jgi:hypothetical protein
MNSERIFLPLYFLTLLLIGLGYLSILPAFEGFDENAHYSSIRQIADTGTIPIYGASFLDQEVTDYQGPSPYGSLTPPFDEGMTYSKFFAQPHLLEHYLLAYCQSSMPTSYRPSQVQNWQSQHPPLYYILLAPLEKITENFSFMTRIFLLRLASFLLALSGVVLGLMACKNSNKPLKDNPSVVGFMLYPLVLPMFFTEFTRIGNDSLCLFLVGTIAFLLSKLLNDENDKKLSLAIGVALGLGLLTKAFFIPITAALCLFLMVRIFLDKRKSTTQLKHWQNLILVLLPAVLIGGGWYVYKFIAFGTLIGSADSIQLTNQGGLTANLGQNFSIYGLVRGLIVTVVSYSYAGTWSLTRLPALLHIPLLWLAAWGFGAFALQIKRWPLTDLAWLPVYLFCTFGGGFLYHIIISLAINGNGNTPGWYLHILMPWVAPALGIGFCSLLKKTRTKPFLIGLLLYAVLFQLMALWSQLALFTGCATKGNDKFYAFSGHAFCLDQTPVLIDHLSVLGWPILAAVGFGVVLICALLLVVEWRKSLEGEQI